MTVGYLIGAHVNYLMKPLPILLESLVRLNKIDPQTIVVVVNGAGKERSVMSDGIRHLFRMGEFPSHFAPLVNHRLGESLEIEYWLYLNCTGKAGPRFRELVEVGYDPIADATLAGDLLPLGKSGGTDGRAINDLAMYRYSYLMRDVPKINSMHDMTSAHAIESLEGVLYAHAPKQAHYPNYGLSVIERQRDIYGCGTVRITEYFPAIDLYRFKKNWGQLTAGSYDAAAI